MKYNLEELEKVVIPAMEFIKKYGNPYTEIRVTCDKVEILQIELGIPKEM